MPIALRPAVELVDGQRQVIATNVADDAPLRALAGSYTVRIKVRAGKSRALTVRPAKTSAARF